MSSWPSPVLCSFSNPRHCAALVSEVTKSPQLSTFCISASKLNTGPWVQTAQSPAAAILSGCYHLWQWVTTACDQRASWVSVERKIPDRNTLPRPGSLSQSGSGSPGGAKVNGILGCISRSQPEERWVISALYSALVRKCKTLCPVPGPQYKPDTQKL